VFLHRYRCWCGTESVRTTTDVDAPDPLDALPACAWEAEVHGEPPTTFAPLHRSAT